MTSLNHNARGVRTSPDDRTSTCGRVPGRTLRSVVRRHFYDRDPREVARDLIGKLLVRRTENRKLLAGRIVEVEAYLGEDDPAAHAAAGKTKRNEVLFGAPGHAYVYFIYGNHYCLNVSCMKQGQAGCVLLRAMEPVVGIETMAGLRGLEEMNGDPRILRNIASGPGKLAQALGITRERDNGKDLTSTKSDLWIAEDGFVPDEIRVTARIGITKASEMPLRFVIAGNPFASGPRGLR